MGSDYIKSPFVTLQPLQALNKTFSQNVGIPCLPTKNISHWRIWAVHQLSLVMMCFLEGEIMGGKRMGICCAAGFVHDRRSKWRDYLPNIPI